MTDIDKVKALLDELKIGYGLEDGWTTTFITLCALEGNLVTGHPGFHACFSFHTASGSFEEVDIYE